MRERDIENYLVRRATAMGGEVRKVSWIGRRGAPDRVVLLPGGRALWVELKAPGKTADPHQAREHARLRAVGQLVYLVDSLKGVDGILE